MHDKFPTYRPRPRDTYILIAVAFFMVGALSWKAAEALLHPPPTWMTIGNRWYDYAIGLVFWLIILVLSFAHAVELSRMKRLGASPVSPDVRIPWESRTKLRIVLYAYASMMFLAVPSAAIKAFWAMNDGSPFGKMSFSGSFEYGTLLGPCFGAAVIYFDRRQVRIEKRRAENLCLICGYDLRASPDRCPECGKQSSRLTK